MGIGQQQLTGKIATRDLMLRSSTLKQGSLSDIIDCTEVSSFIYDIIAKNQKDDARKLLSLTLKVRKSLSNANLAGFINTLRKHITGELIDNFIEQLIEKYTTEEQRKAFIKEVCEVVLDPLPGLRVAEKFSQILNKEHVTEKYSNTSLHLAAEQGNLNAVKYFVEKGADISSENEMGYTPLHLAAKQGNLDIVKYLIEKGANVDVYFYQGGYSTPLHLAAANGHLNTVKYLMAKGANPEATDSDGKTPLQRANENGHLGIVEYFASRGLSVTEVPQTTERQRTTEKQQIMNEDGDTALHLAAMQDDLNAVKYLIEKGADVDVKNKYSATPLHVASIRGNLEIAQFLLDNGADVNAQAINGYAPLHSAIIHNDLAMVKLLLDYCADVNIKEGESDSEHNFGYGTTPLIAAAINCNTEIAKLLLDNGADASIKARGLTALDIANINKDKCPEMLTLLKDGNIKSSDSRSHCTSTIAASSATRTSSFINGLLNWVKNALPQNTIALLRSQQSKNSYSISNSSQVSNDIVNWVKGSVLPTESPALLTSGRCDNTTVTALSEINTTVVNNTMMLGMLVGLAKNNIDNQFMKILCHQGSNQ